MGAISCIAVLALASICRAGDFQLRFAWKQLDYAWESPADREQAIADGQFNQYNNVPLGLARWKNKLFVTCPKWYSGVVSSLNYVDIDGPEDQPLKPYPSFKDNLIRDNATSLPSNSSIVNVFRVHVDPCDRLWVMDMGVAEFFGAENQIAGPSVVIFDLNTDQLLHRYYLKDSDIVQDSFFANIVVDVDKNTCDDAFAYLPDFDQNGMVVYSLKQDDSWRISHHFFHFDPLAGTFHSGGFKFLWSDGVLGMALSEPQANGFRKAFFRPLSSNSEFYVSSDILRNYTKLDEFEAFYDFKYLGQRGEFAQSTASSYDPKTNVIFYTQVSRDGVSCWNINKPVNPENSPLVVSDPTRFEYPNDLKVDDESTLWVLSDKMPRFYNEKLDVNDINFRILSISTTDAIDGTTCE